MVRWTYPAHKKFERLALPMFLTNGQRSSVFPTTEAAEEWLKTNAPRVVIVDDYVGGLGQSAGDSIVASPSVNSVHVQTIPPPSLFSKTNLRYLGGMLHWQDVLTVLDNNPDLRSFYGTVIVDQVQIYERMTGELGREPTKEETREEINGILTMVEERVVPLGGQVVLEPKWID